MSYITFRVQISMDGDDNSFQEIDKIVKKRKNVCLIINHLIMRVVTKLETIQVLKLNYFMLSLKIVVA